MEWIDWLLGPFERIRAGLNWSGGEGEVFVAALLGYALVFLVIAFALHFVFRALARATRWCARKLATGGTLEDVRRLEASSARVEWALLWLATRVVRTSYGSIEQPTRLPGSADETAVLRIVRWALRSLWLMLRWTGALLAALPGFFLTAFGIAVLLAAALTAFPSAIRSGAEAVGSFLVAANWSTAAMVAVATIAAAALPITLIAVKMLVSEAAHARRAFRRGRDEHALEQLHRATPAITALANAVGDQMQEMVRTFDVERYHAGQWHEWAQRATPARHHWRTGRDDHLNCNRECLEDLGTDDREHVYADEVTKAVVGIESAWNDGLKDQKSALARVISRRAWRGLVSLQFCMSSRTGRFWMHKVPSIDEWRRRRIAWQHRQLTWSEPTDADIAAGREVAVRTGCPPEERWLESGLRELVWDLAELSREFADLADFAHALTRPGRFERLARVSEG
ncbi:hypothetical protein GCM10027421_11500 [Microbacterium shaanxiense]